MKNVLILVVLSIAFVGCFRIKERRVIKYESLILETSEMILRDSIIDSFEQKITSKDLKRNLRKLRVGRV